MAQKNTEFGGLRVPAKRGYREYSSQMLRQANDYPELTSVATKNLQYQFNSATARNCRLFLRPG
jgi:hypothetical protein